MALVEPDRIDRYSANTRRNPSETLIITCPGNAFTRSVRKLRSMVSNWETLTTDGFESPDSDLLMRKFPGALASVRLDVTTATTMVAIRLSLNGFDWITSTGRRIPGPEPAGSGSEAHQISPRFTNQALRLRSGELRRQRGTLDRINGIEPLGYVVRSMGIDETGQRFGIELASGRFQVCREFFGGMKNRIWHRDSNLHEHMVSPR